MAAALTGCGAVPASLNPVAPSVRHFASTEPYGPGARLHLFVFDPAEPRSLDARIRLARAAIAGDPECRWIDAPRAYIAEETADQGARYADTLLVAPVACG